MCEWGAGGDRCLFPEAETMSCDVDFSAANLCDCIDSRYTSVTLSEG